MIEEKLNSNDEREKITDIDLKYILFARKREKDMERERELHKVRGFCNLGFVIYSYFIPIQQITFLYSEGTKPF